MIVLSQDEELLQESTSLDLDLSDERLKDLLDLRILKILKEDSRIPNTEIARELEISEGTVRRRIGRLVKEGVIDRFTIELEGP